MQLNTSLIVTFLRNEWCTYYVNILCLTSYYLLCTNGLVLGQRWWWMSTESLQCTPAWLTTHSVHCCMKMTPKDLMTGEMWVTHENEHKLTLCFMCVHEWQVSIGFSGNSAIISSGVYLSNLDLCSWVQSKSPWFMPSRVFHWEFVEFRLVLLTINPACIHLHIIICLL